MVTYEFYTETYKGQTVPSSSFDMYLRKANNLVNKLLSIYTIYNTEEEILENKDYCICEIIDYLYNCNDTIGNNIVSESDGSSSITYNTESSSNYKILSIFGTYFDYYRGG